MDNNSIVPVKPSDNAIVSISNQISLTNKLMANIRRDKKELIHLTSTVTDIDGNVYHTVKIGTQWWMVENLKTSRFRDGSAIIEIQDDTSWDNAGESKKAAWCYYDNDAKNNRTYGKLYNWYAVSDPRGLCPAGWHVPSDEEFKLLEDYLGGPDMAGGKMKATNLDSINEVSVRDFLIDNVALPLWKVRNTGADNSGFAALPAGSRDVDGTFKDFGYNSYFWSSKELNSEDASFCYLDYDNSNVSRGNYFKAIGLSVRCVGD